MTTDHICRDWYNTFEFSGRYPEWGSIHGIGIGHTAVGHCRKYLVWEKDRVEGGGVEGLGRAGWDSLLAPLCCRIFRRENFIKGWHWVWAMCHWPDSLCHPCQESEGNDPSPNNTAKKNVQQKEHDVLHPVLVRQAGHLRVNSRLCQVKQWCFQV